MAHRSVEDSEDDADPGVDCEDPQSDTVSVTSTIYRGLIENGRRYQIMRENEYWSPADELQFESLEAGHAVAVVLESDESNPFFRSPIGDCPQAIDVADMFPSATVHGVDLFPPPVSWVPPNCILEVDDLARDWTWEDPFDLIHLRIMIGAFTPEEWDQVYQRCYENLKPGGWIEQLEVEVHVRSDDNSVRKDVMGVGVWGDITSACAERSGRRIDTLYTMRSSIEAAGFVNVHEKNYKWPIGPWPKDETLQEVGEYNYQMWATGLEGWGMFLLTKFGAPRPWPREQVQDYGAAILAELRDPKVHAYQRARRVWAQKPLSEETMQPKGQRSDF